MNRYVDLHAVILPEMRFEAGDPFSTVQAMEPSLAEKALRNLLDSGMKAMVTAPYFDACVDDSTSFLKKRDAHLKRIREVVAKTDSKIAIRGGATVAFAHALRDYPSYVPLAIENTNYLMISLPKQPPSADILARLDRVQIACNLTPILANVDAYYDCMELNDLYVLQRAGVLLQVSAEGFMSSERRNLSLYLLSNQLAQFIASGSGNAAPGTAFLKAMRMVKASMPIEMYKRLKTNSGLLLSNPPPTEYRT